MTSYVTSTDYAGPVSYVTSTDGTPTKSPFAGLEWVVCRGSDVVAAFNTAYAANHWARAANRREPRHWTMHVEDWKKREGSMK